jgi:hypothetical protein
MATKAEEVMPFLADPQRKAEDERRQALRRQSFSRARLSPGPRMISRGVQFERMARKVLEKNDSEQARRQLAHGLHLQGKNVEAAGVSPDEAAEKHYLDVYAAIELDDELCTCPRKEVDDPLTGKKLSISPRRHLKDVYSPKHGEVVALMGCENGCPLNARPLTGQAREIANNVRAAHRTVADARKRVVSDIQVLKEKS